MNRCNYLKCRSLRAIYSSSNIAASSLSDFSDNSCNKSHHLVCWSPKYILVASLCERCCFVLAVTSSSEASRATSKGSDEADEELTNALLSSAILKYNANYYSCLIKLTFLNVRRPLWNLICTENMRRTDLTSTLKAFLLNKE